MKKSYLSLSLLVALGLWSCDANSDTPSSDNTGDDRQEEKSEPKMYSPIILADGMEELPGVNNEFGFDLFRSVSGNGASNIVVSPLNTVAHLSILANGDEGEVRDEILQAMGFRTGEAALALLNSYMKTMMEKLPDVDNVSHFKFAASLWHNSESAPVNSFVDNTSSIFGLCVADESPAGEAGKDAINKWVESQTEGMIPQFLKNTVEANGILINTSYFRGLWASTFSNKYNHKGLFHNSNGTTNDVEYMHHELPSAGVFEDSDMKAAKLDFGNGHYSMLVVQPNSEGELQNMIGGFNAGKFNKIVNGFENAGLTIDIPKFDIIFEKDYNNILYKMGIKKIVDEGLSGIFSYKSGDETKFKVNSHPSAVRFTIDEQGVKAAAAEASVSYIMDKPDRQMTLNLDRPFLYVLYESSTNTILFIGSITSL